MEQRPHPFRTSRRQFLLGAASILTSAMPAFAQEELSETFADGMVMRRPKSPGEDDTFYTMGQLGPYLLKRDLLSIDVDGMEILVQAPAGLGRGPLVVFSHGVLTDPRVYKLMIYHLASHGFVVAAPVHQDALSNGGLGAREVTVSAQASWNVERILANPDAWAKRCRDCSKVLDVADRISQTVGMQADTSRPILIGHEYGALCAQLSMGAKSDQIEEDVVDPRWFCSALLSPQGPGIMGLENASWTAMSRPLLAVIGANERDYFGQEPLVKASCFMLSPPGNKHLAWFASGNENLYAGPRAGVEAAESRRFEDLLAIVTSFCTAYGRYDEAVFSRLASDWIERETLGRVSTRYR